MQNDPGIPAPPDAPDEQAPTYTPPATGNGLSGAPQIPPPPPPYPDGRDGAQYSQPAPRPSVQGEQSNTKALIWIGVVFVLLLLISVGYVVGGEAQRFVGISLAFVPFALLAALAYAGRRNTLWAVLCYAWLAIVSLAVMFNAFANTLLAVVKLNVLLDVLENNRGLGSVSAPELFKPGAGPELLWLMLLMFLSGIVALLMLLRPVRATMSRIMPVDPDDFVHKVALVILAVIFLTSISPLIVLGGYAPLLQLTSSPDFARASDLLGLNTRPIDLVYQSVWMIPATFVAAGWPVARRFPEMLRRLGFVRPTLVQVIAGVVLGVVLAALAALVIDPGIFSFWKMMGWPTTNQEAFGELMKNMRTPVGAVLVGVTAGIGEELAVRGLLQPRIGLIASNLLFTSLHALQYGVDALLSVFLIGLVLGIIRAKTNTSTSAIVHGVYDFVQVMAWVVAGQ